MDVEELFNNIVRDFEEADRNKFNSDIRVLTECVNKLETNCHTLYALFQNVENEILQDALANIYNSNLSLYNNIQAVLHNDILPQNTYSTGTFQNGNPGRPKFDISMEQLVYLRNLGFTWSSLSKLLHISRQTLYRRKKEFNLQEDTISDDHLQNVIRHILRETPNAGEVYILGSLRAKNVMVTRGRVRQTLRILDPVGRALRKRTTICRRIYNVKGANYLWHMDSNHKLVNYRFVYHGCIDGYSRAIIYLECLNNNRADSVLRLFQNGVRKFGLPNRVRGDRGTENIGVATFLITERGLNRGSFIVGRSVHNQRIERLWSEVNRVVTKYYKELFSFMKESNIFSETNEIDLFALNYIYLPRIKQSLQEFVNQWNHHGLSTMNNRSPLQLWTTAYLEDNFKNDDSLYWENPDRYGIDHYGTLVQIETENNIVIPDTEIELTEEYMQHLTTMVPNPLENDNNHGINLYVTIKNLLEQILL